MIVIPPIDITDAMLTSSSAYEAAPAAYNSGTTYSINAYVSVAGSLGQITVYRSLQNSNLNHTPASSPSWWENHCNTYNVYNGSTNYLVDEYAIDTTTHKIYRSLVHPNSGNAQTDTDFWEFIGTTNRWAMFDTDRSAGTVQAAPIVAVLTPGQRVNSLALTGLIGSYVTVSMTVSAVSVFSRTISITGRQTLTWSDYFFGDFEHVESVLITDLPPYSNGVITVTISGTGVVQCSSLVIGLVVNIGRVIYGARNDALNFSRIERDDFGNSVLVPRRTVPKTNQTILFNKNQTNTLIGIRKLLNAKPAVWSGVDDENSDYFESLLIIGIYKQFEIELTHPSHGMLNLELEEL